MECSRLLSYNAESGAQAEEQPSGSGGGGGGGGGGGDDVDMSVAGLEEKKTSISRSQRANSRMANLVYQFMKVGKGSYLPPPKKLKFGKSQIHR